MVAFVILCRKTFEANKKRKSSAWAFTSNTERHNIAFGKQTPPWDIDKILSLK